MRYRGLGQVDAFFNVARAKTRLSCLQSLSSCLSLAFLQSLQDSAPGGIGNGVQNAVER